jgi:hypothetical protein
MLASIMLYPYTLTIPLGKPGVNIASLNRPFVWCFRVWWGPELQIKRLQEVDLGLLEVGGLFMQHGDG